MRCAVQETRIPDSRNFGKPLAREVFSCLPQETAQRRLRHTGTAPSCVPETWRCPPDEPEAATIPQYRSGQWSLGKRCERSRQTSRTSGKTWCEGGDSNPYTAMASGPKPGASTNFATLAFAQSRQFYCILSGLGWLAPSRRICPSCHPSVYRDITRRTGKPACCKKINNPSPQRE